ncbi:hypothetical protein C8R44DRAFT_892988 [Mycena epipterygia]|nr:hypothetical protein C8R44DRAFT_892988 [Mycena epipterygia]
MAGGNDPPRWVKSPHPLTKFYFRPNTGSRWRGPRDNRTWVPAMDTPLDFPPPPDDFADCDPDVAMPAAPPTGCQCPRNPVPLLRVWNRRVARPTPHTRCSALKPLLAGMDPILTPAARDTAGHSPIRLRSEYRGRYINRPVEPPRTEDLASRCRDDDGHRVDEWRSDYARRGPDYPRREYDDRNRDDRDDCDYRSSSTRTLSPRAPRTDVRSGYANSLDSKTRRDNQRAATQAIQDKARSEQVLRERALRSRPPSDKARSVPPAPATNPALSTPFVAQPAPDVLAAPRDSNGLPIYPEEPVPDDVSEYVGSDEESDEDTPEFNAKLRKWRNRERIRQQDVAQDAAKGTKARPTTPPAMDPARTSYWGSLTYCHHGGSAVPTPLDVWTMSSGARHVPALDTLVWPPAPASAPRRYTIPNEGTERRRVLLASGDHWRFYPTVAPTYERERAASSITQRSGVNMLRNYVRLVPMIRALLRMSVTSRCLSHRPLERTGNPTWDPPLSLLTTCITRMDLLNAEYTWAPPHT